jgi:hypothetical protein
MSDNITLPREVVERVETLMKIANKWSDDVDILASTVVDLRDDLTELRTALAAPRLEVTVDPRLTPDEAAAISSALAAPRAEPVAYFDLQKQVFFWAKPTMIDVPMTVALNPLPLYAAPPAAAPRPEPSGYAYRYADNVLRFNDGGWLSGWPPVEAVPYWFAPPAAAPEPEKRHPGYIIGNHWLETAYERLCAGEAEDAILEDYELVREPRLRDLRRDAERYRWLRDWLDNNGLLVRAIRGESLAGYEHPNIEALRRDAERLNWVRVELFRPIWDGATDKPCEWHLRDDYKHTIQRMQGNNFRAAIDAAMEDKT